MKQYLHIMYELMYAIPVKSLMGNWLKFINFDFGFLAHMST